MALNGFTLIELLVALLLAGVAVAISAGLYTQAADALTTAQARMSREQQESAALAWLQEAALGARTTPGDGPPIAGNQDSVTFASSTLVPAGWPERTSVTVAVDSGHVRIRIGRETRVFPESIETGALDYLERYGADSPWLPAWSSQIQAPLAIRLRRTFVGGGGDTLLLYVGRGR